MTRRTWWTYAGAVLAAGLWPARSAAKLYGISRAALRGLFRRNGAVSVTVAGTPLLLIAPDGRRVRALGGQCTHRKCPVRYNPATGHVDCTCHGSSFALDGRVLRGPARRPLPVYPVRTEADKIVVELPR